MKQSFALLVGLAFMSAFTACSNDDEFAVAKTDNQLVVKAVGLAGVDTKAGITATAFAGNESIGLYVNNGPLGTKYDNDVDYENVKYTANGGANWATESMVTLTNVSGTVRAYYPYSEDNGVYTPSDPNVANNGTSIQLRVNATQGTGIGGVTADDPAQIDYMWATPVENVSSSKPDVSLSLNHALTMLSFQFTNSTEKPYPGVGKVSKITLKNKDGVTPLKAGLATMNIDNGEITLDARAAAAEFSVLPNAESLKNVADLNAMPRFLVFPANSATATNINAGDIIAEIILDDVKFSLKLPAIPGGFVAGKNYQFQFTIKGVELEVDQVTIKPWVTIPTSAGDIQDPDDQVRVP
ncbi:MAG: fimbrillin family protein [Parabacteroides sp.]